MSIVKKLKDILFEEEDYTEQIPIREEKKEIKEETPKIVKIEPIEREEIKEVPKEIVYPERTERETIREPEKSFEFPDFDEEEFMSSISRQKPNTNVLEYERKKTIEKRTDYGRYERVETREYIDKKKFKPSPIISPVYGILNQDYKAEDIVKREDVASNITIEEVRKKAFEVPIKEEVKKEAKKEVKPEIKEEIDTISEPVVTFFEEKDSLNVKEKKEDNYKTIDDLLDEASNEVDFEDTLEIPSTNNLETIEEELEKLDSEEVSNHKDFEDPLDSDLFELIDSMYDDREEV